MRRSFVVHERAGTDMFESTLRLRACGDAGGQRQARGRAHGGSVKGPADRQSDSREPEAADRGRARVLVVLGGSRLERRYGGSETLRTALGRTGDAVLVGGLINSELRLSRKRSSRTSANISRWETPRPLNVSSGTDGASSGAAVASSGARHRTRRQTLSVPEGSVIGIIPKFGWLLYQGEDDEELDFVVETEFLYRFPGNTGSEVGETRVDNHYYDPGFDYDGFLKLHRQKRMVRDKKVVYKSVANIFNRLGLEGKACLLKTICEISGNPLLHDGLIGELLNMALIPSHSLDGAADELEEYREAETLGASGRSCRAAFSQCPVSLFTQLEA